MDTRFSAGPWHLEDTTIRSLDYWPVCEMGLDIAMSKRINADARLIIAAPELFEALQQIVNSVDKGGVAFDKSGEFWDGIEAATAALAKATGEK